MKWSAIRKIVLSLTLLSISGGIYLAFGPAKAFACGTGECAYGGGCYSDGACYLSMTCQCNSGGCHWIKGCPPVR